MAILVIALFFVILFVAFTICGTIYMFLFAKKFFNLLELRKYEDAYRIIELRIKKHPRRIVYYYYELLIYYETGDLDSVLNLIQFIDKNIKKSTYNKLILNIKIKVLYLKNNIELANKECNQWVKTYGKKIDKNRSLTEAIRNYYCGNYKQSKLILDSINSSFRADNIIRYIYLAKICRQENNMNEMNESINAAKKYAKGSLYLQYIDNEFDLGNSNH